MSAHVVRHGNSQGAVDRLPPYDREAEEAVIAACLLDPDSTAKLAPLVAPADFFRQVNAWVYEAIMAVLARDGAYGVNQVTVAHELARRERLEDAGGIGYLARLAADLPTVIGVEYYAAIVRRCSQQRRLLAVAGELASAAYANVESPERVIAHTQNLLTDILGERTGGWEVLGDLLAARMAGWQEWMRAPKAAPRAMPTGLRALDGLLAGGGIRPGKLYLVGGMTSMGKSSVIRWILRNLALSGRTVALLTPEQDRGEVIEELAFATAGIDTRQLDAGEPVSAAQWQAFDRAVAVLSPLRFWVEDEPELTIDRVRTRLGALRAKHSDLTVVGVDYVQLINSDNPRDAEAERIGKVAQAIRDLGKQMGVAILLGTQLVKAAGSKSENEDFRPRLVHFRGSGMLVNVAYCILGLYRPDYVYLNGLAPVPKELQNLRGEYEPTDDLFLHVLKQQRGPTGVARLKFARNTRAVVDIEDYAS